MRIWKATGCGLWIAGLAVFIIGLNLDGSIKDWMTVGGSIIFLAGLAITGAAWMKTKPDESRINEKKATDHN